MAMRVDSLPYDVGRFTPRWRAAFLALTVVALVGFAAFVYQVEEGPGVTGLRNIGPGAGATWGLYVALVVFFVGISFSGITIAALIRLLHIDTLRPVARMAELLTVVALVLAGLLVLADLGDPIRGFVNLFQYARPQSPFFGTFTLVVSGYLFASLVYLYLDGRRDAAWCAQHPGPLQRFHRIWAAGYRDTAEARSRHDRTSLWLALAIIPLLVAAHSTLGFVFGLQVGRPGWYSALQAPAFVLLAGVSGVGMLIIVAAAMRSRLDDRLGDDVLRWLGRLLAILLVAYLYFLVVEVLTATYTGHEQELDVVRTTLTGRYAWIYWTSVAFLLGALAIIVVGSIRRRTSTRALIAAGALVVLASVGKRFLVVVPSQTDGPLLPYEPGSYSPTWVELVVVAGLLALGTLLYIGFARVFPITEVVTDTTPPGPAERSESAEHRRRRWIIALVMVAVGITLQLLSYFVLSAPLGRPSKAADADPQVPFAPTLFVLGVILVFLAAVVYELLPDRPRRRATTDAVTAA